MAQNNTFEMIKEILIAKLGDKIEGDIKPEARFKEDLHADSLDLVELIMEFEDKFHVAIDDKELMKLTTVGDAVKYIDAHPMQD